MISERTICDVLGGLLPAGRLNRAFESDAEIIQLGRSRYLFTTDEFSAEDLFGETDAYALGRNVAAGACSDILACGGVPVYYAHAVTVDDHWDLKYLRRFGRGVRAVLQATGARFIGGDCGRASQWRCTASVIGTCRGRPISRRGAMPGQAIYVSGVIGAGNLQAAARIAPAGGAMRRKTLRLPVRLREAAIMRRHAAACIDTSDGLCAALDMLAEVNGCGYRVTDLPYVRAGVRLAAQTGLPQTLLALGGCGEYELLFTIPPHRERALVRDAATAGCRFHRLGVVTKAGRVLREGDRELDLGSLRLLARDFGTAQEYLAALVAWLKEHGHGAKRSPTEEPGA
jgi:thiamine-monophosphate kinase